METSRILMGFGLEDPQVLKRAYKLYKEKKASSVCDKKVSSFHSSKQTEPQSAQPILQCC